MDLDGKLIIKVRLDDDIRVIPIHNEEITYDELLLMMQRIFNGKLQADDEVLIKYRDEDGDMVTIFDSNDLALAIAMSRLLKLTLYVRPKLKDLSYEDVWKIRSSLNSVRATVDTLLERLDLIEAPRSKIDDGVVGGGDGEKVVADHEPALAPRAICSKEFDPLEQGERSETSSSASVADDLAANQAAAAAPPRGAKPGSGGSPATVMVNGGGGPPAGRPQFLQQQQQPPPPPQQQQMSIHQPVLGPGQARPPMTNVTPSSGLATRPLASASQQPSCYYQPQGHPGQTHPDAGMARPGARAPADGGHPGGPPQFQQQQPQPTMPVPSQQYPGQPQHPVPMYAGHPQQPQQQQQLMQQRQQQQQLQQQQQAPQPQQLGPSPQQPQHAPVGQPPMMNFQQLRPMTPQGYPAAGGPVPGPSPSPAPAPTSLAPGGTGPGPVPGPAQPPQAGGLPYYQPQPQQGPPGGSSPSHFPPGASPAPPSGTTPPPLGPPPMMAGPGGVQRNPYSARGVSSVYARPQYPTFQPQ